MQHGHGRGFRLAVAAAALLAAMACGEDLRGSLNDVLDEAENEIHEAFETYAEEVASLRAQRAAVPRCGDGPFEELAIEQERFDSDEEYYAVNENCRLRQLLREQANEVDGLLRGISPSQWIQMIQMQRDALEPMSDAELASVGPGMRRTFGAWRIEEAEAAAERRRERLSNAMESFKQGVRELNEAQ